ncbi:hypothetical protein ACB092_02G091200 [Castanea dentata]
MTYSMTSGGQQPNTSTNKITTTLIIKTVTPSYENIHTSLSFLSPKIMRLLNKVLAVLLVLFLLQHVQIQSCKASRLLYKGGELLHKGLGLQSLQRGPVAPSGPSGCTYIPGTNGPGCPVNEMHYARNALPRASPYPRLMGPFGMATKEK